MLLSTPTHFHSFSAHSHPIPFPLILTPFRPMCSLPHPFPVPIQVLSPNPTYHLPLQPIFSPCVLHVYVLYVPVWLCAYVFHVPTYLCNSFLCTLLPMPISWLVRGFIPLFSKIPPFLEIQDVPTFFRLVGKTKVLKDSFNRFVDNFYTQSILILEEYLQKW